MEQVDTKAIDGDGDKGVPNDNAFSQHPCNVCQSRDGYPGDDMLKRIIVTDTEM